MVRVWLDDFEKDVIIAALNGYLNEAKDHAQWAPFTDAISRLEDKIFHAGDEDE